MKDVEEAGGSLNYNFGVAETSFPGAEVLKHFTYTTWLDDADAIY
jgi:hypothetical protein